MKFLIFKFNATVHMSYINFDDMTFPMLRELCSLGYRVELQPE